MTYKPDTNYSKLGSDKYQLLTRTKCKQPKFCGKNSINLNEH